jgi:hypothetical protein
MEKLELRINTLEKKKFRAIEKYLNSRKFQREFPKGYLEDGKKYSGKILVIEGEPISKTSFYADVTIKLREDDDLNYDVVRHSLDKIAKQYGKIVKMIFSKNQ